MEYRMNEISDEWNLFSGSAYRLFYIHFRWDFDKTLYHVIKWPTRTLQNNPGKINSQKLEWFSGTIDDLSYIKSSWNNFLF